ncbi:MAG: ATP-binding protein [Saprospiraceae bacterium]|nr:ATP-binding protein [Saprospiraceae bacterium]MCC6280090.1 ATP-binding protein [Saprospiraceae bacterium]
MLIEFSFANFRSFQDLTTLSMVAAKISSKYEELDTNNVFKADTKLNLLKSKAIYGQNASGKSNIIKALVTFLMIVRHSVKSEEVISKLASPFQLNATNSEKPTFFQIILCVSPKEGETALYRYGFEVKDGKIVTEWLFGKIGREEVPFFTRQGMDIQAYNRFREAKKFAGLSQSGDNEIFRDNSLFLTAVSAMGGTFAKSITEIISDITIVMGLGDPRIKSALQEILKDKEAKESILALMRAADFDIDNIESLDSDSEDQGPPDDMPDELKELFRQGKIKKTPSFVTQRPVFGHKGEKVSILTTDFDEWESEGTKKLFYLSAFLLQTLKDGDVLFIDEFDARLHPLLTKKIVQLFNSNDTNPKGAQLIFVTHDTNLLKANLLRRDQICFVNKDKFGISTLRTLVEYKGVRNDASYDKDYLSGKYAAVPFLNRLDQIFEN